MAADRAPAASSLVHPLAVTSWTVVVTSLMTSLAVTSLVGTSLDSPYRLEAVEGFLPCSVEGIPPCFVGESPQAAAAAASPGGFPVGS